MRTESGCISNKLLATPKNWLITESERRKSFEKDSRALRTPFSPLTVPPRVEMTSWITTVDSDGRLCYFNSYTSNTSYSKPANAPWVTPAVAKIMTSLEAQSKAGGSLKDLLLAAAASNDVHSINELLLLKVDPNVRHAESTQTVLMLASQQSNGLAAVKALLQAKANVQHRFQDTNREMVSVLELATRSLAMASKLGVPHRTQIDCQSIVTELRQAKQQV